MSASVRMFPASARADATGSGPLSPPSSVKLIANNRRTRSPAAAAILEPGVRACAGGCG